MTTPVNTSSQYRDPWTLNMEEKKESADTDCNVMAMKCASIILQFVEACSLLSQV